jgi:hypothetical protein
MNEDLSALDLGVSLSKRDHLMVDLKYEEGKEMHMISGSE